MELSHLAQSLQMRLLRKTQKLPSNWAEQVVIYGEPFPGPFRFKYHPWTRAMLESETEMNVGKKAAQMGYSAVLLNRSLFLVDIRKESVLYLLPTKTPDATDFSSTKFDPLLESSPHLQNLFTDVKNVGTKRAGLATLYIRGANSRNSLKSLSVSTILFDEFDEMPEKNIPLARARVDGQRRSQEWMVSTPTLPGFGIDAEFTKSNQQHYYFPCPCCSRRIKITPDNLIIPDDQPKLAHLICLECKNQLTDPTEPQEELTERKASWYNKAEWVPEVPSSDTTGWHINQGYSCAKAGNPIILATKKQAAETNKAKEQEYWNSNWGDAHECEGARLTDELIIKSTRNYVKQPYAESTTLNVMGVDVGAWLHVEIDQCTVGPGNDPNLAAKVKLLWEGKLPTNAGFPELDEFMRNYNIRACVIDANPERSSAMAFAKRFWGWTKLCFYNKGISTTEISNLDDPSNHKVAVDRTLWLDIALGRFAAGTIILPKDVSLEYKKHLCNIARIYEEDKDGNPVGKYVNNGDDHYAHSRNYAEIALAVATTHAPNRTITH